MSEQALIQKRGRVKGTLTRLKAFAENIPDSTTLEDLLVRLKNLDDVWSEFQSIEDHLMLCDNQTSDMEEYERKYYDTKSALSRAVSTKQPRQNHDVSFAEQFNSTMNQFLTQQQDILQTVNQRNLTNGNVSSNIGSVTPRLPKLNVPTFFGDYSEWPSFKDLFEASVHNNPALTASQKLQYLKGLLVGNAASVIKHLTISDANYSEAWAKLTKRFDKKNHIVTSLIRTFANHPSINQPGVKPLRNLCDCLDEVIRGLKALGPQAESRDPWLIYLALTKLDNETRELWASKLTEWDFPTFNEFLEFLSNRCDALETCSTLTKRATVPIKSLVVTSSRDQISSSSLVCPKCCGDHRLYECKGFKSDSPQDRKSFVISKSLCFKCLGANHSVRACRSKVHCKSCKGQHHPLLHISTCSHTASSHVSQTFESPAASTSSQQVVQNSVPPSDFNQSQVLTDQSLSSINLKSFSTTSDNDISTENRASKLTSFSSLNTCIQRQDLHSNPNLGRSACKVGALLPTALVSVRDCRGKLVPCRVLLDSGSQVCLISESCTQRLGLKRQAARLLVTGLQSSGGGTTKGQISLNIHSRFNETDSITATVFILNNLTSRIPTVSQVVPQQFNVNGLRLADPKFHEPSQIDIILGADHFFEILRGEQLYDEEGKPFAQNTMFGWVVFGKFHESNLSAVSLTTTIEHIDKTLQLFSKTEEVSQETKLLTSEEEKCEKHFIQNCARTDDGRYIVALPFKKNSLSLGESKSSAVKRLYAMERRFCKDPIFKKSYVQFMREYLQLGHMELISKAEESMEDDKCYYLPHHAVFKNAPKPKIRVVFDGSCKSSSGISLNEKLMVGPTIQRDLLAILLSFRKHKIAFAADVEKMYRQVLVTPANRDYQRIVWRENPTSPIKHYRLKTVTYGTASAPFLATRVLHQIGESNKQQYPKISSIIQSDFYVDDLLSGCDSLSDALSFKAEISTMFSSSGLHLAKWKSNSKEFVKGDSISSINSHTMSIDSDPEVTKVLGVLWNHNEDIFSFTVHLNDSPPISKRGILSEASRIFDPLGWLAPTVVVVKIFFQKLWISKYGWDDELCPRMLQTWKRWRSQLYELMQIKIPRQIWSSPYNVELHGFSDASETAYGAVVYCRSVNSDGKIVSRIVAAKTKVAPLRQISLPRLELCAAVLLVRLIDKIKESLSLKDFSVFAWTDSAIVLSWLSDVPRRWKTYIANRTSEILEKLPRCCWRHVPSKQNPADLASRGVLPHELPSHQLWWRGPEWLLQDSNSWPSGIPVCSDNTIHSEERTKGIVALHQSIVEDVISEVIGRTSSFSKLIRVVAYCLRFIINSKVKKHERQFGYICAREINYATVVCIRNVQQRSFSSEIRALKTKGAISKKSSISALSPFIDQQGILRVGGRLQKAHGSFCAKHPAILPKNCQFSELLVREMHRNYLHPGTSLLMAILRQQYWIVGARDLVRKLSKGCITCFRQRSTRPAQLMGNLPEHRVTPARAFLKVGIDYAGPFSLCVKTGRGSKPLKGYIALFICVTTKALHLELVSSLSTEAFIAALRRFAARRGIPSHIYSDNGTNFVGAKRFLNELHNLVLSNYTNEIFCYFLAQNKITWSFIPPSAPHFGGLWEVNVKAVKWHLRRVVGETILTFEEMMTVLHQIEAILNSRPYCALTPDADDLDALTPGHFLIGEPLTTLPEPDLDEMPLSRLGRWQQLQAMVQGFWKRWRLEYISSLQERHKWRTEVDSLKKDELVIVRDDSLPPSKWLLGRVELTHPGEDGLVRVVTLRTKKGIMKRGINKVLKLPVS